MRSYQVYKVKSLHTANFLENPLKDKGKVVITSGLPVEISYAISEGLVPTGYIQNTFPLGAVKSEVYHVDLDQGIVYTDKAYPIYLPIYLVSHADVIRKIVAVELPQAITIYQGLVKYRGNRSEISAQLVGFVQTPFPIGWLELETQDGKAGYVNLDTNQAVYAPIKPVEDFICKSL